MMKLHLISFMCAVIAYVYSAMLTKPDMVLAPLYRFLDKKIGKYEIIFKPLIDCFRCVSGQLALWSFLYLLFPNYVTIGHCTYFTEALTLAVKTIFTHVYFITLTIYISWMLDRLHGP